MKLKQLFLYLLLGSCCCVTNNTEGMFRQSKRCTHKQTSLLQCLKNIIANLHEKSVIIFGAHPLQSRHIDRYEDISQKCKHLTYIDLDAPDLTSIGFCKTVYIISNGKLKKYEPIGKISLNFFMNQERDRAEFEIIDSTGKPMLIEFTKDNITVIQSDFNSYLVQEYFKQTSFHGCDLAIFDYHVTTILNNVELPLIKFILECVLSAQGVIAIDLVPPDRNNSFSTECINEIDHREFIDFFIPPTDERDVCLLLGII